MQIEESMKKPFSIFVLVLFALVIVYVFALTRNAFTENSFIGRSDAQIYTISISGEGKVTAIPDIAQISLGLDTENLKVDVAQKENTDKMNAIISALNEMGISKEDIKTSNYNIYPQYDYNPTTGRQTLRGYSVSQSVTVKIRDLSKVGQTIEKAASLGANQVGGLNFTIDEPEELRQQARVKALENATAKAKSLAEVAGVKIGKIVSFNESVAGGYPIYLDYAKAESYGMGGGNAAPTVEPGSQEIIINVAVTYEVL